MRRLAFVEGLDGFYVTYVGYLTQAENEGKHWVSNTGPLGLVGIVMRCTYLSCRREFIPSLLKRLWSYRI
jgi:hypothetical protein